MRPTTPALLLSTNCSISDKSKHISTEELYELFMTLGTRELSDIEKYIIETIQSEAHPQEVQSFQTLYKIPQDNIEKLLSYKPYDC